MAFPWRPGDPGEMEQYTQENYSWILVSDDGSDQLKNLRHREANINIPIAIQNVNYMKKLKSNDYLVKIPKSHREEALKINKILNIPVKVTEHRKMNYSKGTIFHNDIPSYSEEELLGDLKIKNKNIVAVEKSQFWQNKILTDSKIAIVTFDDTQIPNHIFLHYEKCNVKLYIPQPTRCKNCWSFDHFSSRSKPCTQPPICGHCALDFHLEKKDDKIEGRCTNDMACLNCGSKRHPAWSRLCPKYLKEKEIVERMTRQRISYNAAKNIVIKEKQDQENQKYATATMTGLQNTTPGQMTTKDYPELQEIRDLTNQMKILVTLITQQLQTAGVEIPKELLPSKSNDSDDSENMSTDTDNGGSDITHLHRVALKTVQNNSVPSSPMEESDWNKVTNTSRRRKKDDTESADSSPPHPKRKSGNNNPAAKFSRQSSRGPERKNNKNSP